VLNHFGVVVQMLNVLGYFLRVKPFCGPYFGGLTDLGFFFECLTVTTSYEYHRPTSHECHRPTMNVNILYVHQQRWLRIASDPLGTIDPPCIVFLPHPHKY